MLIALGAVLIVAGIVLRVLVDGNPVQVPVMVLLLAGLACFFLYIRKRRTGGGS